MKTQGSTRTGSPVFQASEYGIVVVVLACLYFASLLGVIVLARALESRLVGIAITTAIYTGIFVLVNAVYRPQYVPGVRVCPDDAAHGLVMAGALLLGAWFLLRSPTMDAFLEGVLLVIFDGFAAFGLIEFTQFVAKRLPPDWPKYLPAYALSLLGFGAALVFLMTSQFRGSYTERLLAQINVGLWAVLWMQVMFVLDHLCTKKTETTPIEEGHALAIIQAKRIQRIVIQAPSAEIVPKVESCVAVDLRLRTALVHHECASKDRHRVHVDVSCEWRVVDAGEYIHAFLTCAQDPERALRDRLRAAISNEIGKRTGTQAMEWQALICERVTRRIRCDTHEFGICVRAVHLRTMQVTPAPVGTPKTNVSPQPSGYVNTKYVNLAANVQQGVATGNLP